MANYHTSSDCGCSQNMPQCQMPGRPCSGGMPKRQMPQKPCPSQRQMSPKPCPASMPPCQGTPRPCPANVPPCQTMPKPCADMPKHPVMPKPACPSMPKEYFDKLDLLAGMPIAMAYVPWQFFHETFEPDKALECGTIFPELSKPFCGKGGCPK